MASTAHLDSKGHHPKVRPYNRHNKYGVSIKMARLLSPKVMLLCASDDELLETMVVEMGCPDSGMWYVDTAGCAMLQANDAEPPPQRGWLRKAVQCAAVFLLGLMLLAGPTSCKKEPQPSPTPTPTPTDTITPVNPGDTITPTPGNDTIVPGQGGDTIVPGHGDDTLQPGTGGKIVKFIYRGGGIFPPLDSIRRYANDPEYDTIYIKWLVPGASHWTPIGFNSAYKELKKCFDVSQKVCGAGFVIPYQILSDADSTNHGVMGMIQSNRVWYEANNYTVMPVVGNKVDRNTKSVQPSNYNGNQGKNTKFVQSSHYNANQWRNAKSVQPPRYNGNRVLRAGRSH